MEEEEQQKQNSPRNVKCSNCDQKPKNLHVEREKECKNSFSLKLYLINPYIW